MDKQILEKRNYQTQEGHYTTKNKWDVLDIVLLKSIWMKLKCIKQSSPECESEKGSLAHLFL